jgi:hypothetical protein
MSINKLVLFFCAGILLSACDSAEEASQSADGTGVQAAAMPADLRAEVDNVKAQLAQSPTNRQNVQERGMLLWRWVNVYSLQGGVVPVELPLIVAAINMRPLPEGDTEPNLLGFPFYQTIDRFLRELALREDEPNAFGTLAITSSSGPFPAGSYQTLVQTYTVGSRGIDIGGGFLLTGHMIANGGDAQITDPAAENYVGIKSSREGVSFTIDSYPVGGQHGGFMSGGKDTPVYRVSGARLEPGDTVTLTYGDTSGGSKGFLMQNMSSERMPLPVYVALSQGNEFLTLPIQPITITGVEATGVMAFAPSIVKVGEPFALHLRSHDKYSNKASSAVPAYKVTLNGKLIETTAAGQALTSINGLSLAQPGTYRYEIASEDGQVKTYSNPVWVQENPQHRIYWGETHAHSGLAEGLGTADELQRFARDEAHLDFLGHSEHDAWMDDYEWSVLQSMAAKYTEQGKFLSFLAYEWSAFPPNGGHHNVFFKTPQNHVRIPIQTHPKLADLYRGLAETNGNLEDVLIIPHAHMPGDWRQNDNRMERLVEISSVHGTFEWFGQNYVAQGAHVGFIAGADDHTSHPGLAFIYNDTYNRSGLAAVNATELTLDSIFGTLRDRNVYATTGARILMDVDVNGADMGQRAAFSPERKITAKISASAPIASLAIVKNGEEIWGRTLNIVQNGTPTQHLRVSLFSSSVPFKNQFDMPRGYRKWTGTVEVEGATVRSVIADGIRKPLYQYARQAAGDPQRVEFHTATRGATEGFVIELADISPTAKVTVKIEPTKEGSASLPYKGREAMPMLAGGEFTFALADIAKSPREGELVYDNFYRDIIGLRFDKGEPILDIDIDHTDRDVPRPGDSYYVRVLQIDGHQAWSSPIWVGEASAAQTAPASAPSSTP